MDQRGPPLDSQAARKNPILQNPAIDTGGHGIGDRSNSGADRFVLLPGSLVGAHDLGDRQPLVRRNPQQVRTRAKAIGYIPQAAFRIVAANLVLVQHRPAADRIIDPALDRLIIEIGDKAHRIAVKIEPFFLVKDDVRLFIERERAGAIQANFRTGPDLVHQHVRCIRFDMFRSLPRQTQQNRPVGGMALAGQRQRAKEQGLHASHLIQLTGIGQTLDKHCRGQHRSHGMRARWTDPYFEKLERAGDHKLLSSPAPFYAGRHGQSTIIGPLVCRQRRRTRSGGGRWPREEVYSAVAPPAGSTLACDETQAQKTPRWLREWGLGLAQAADMRGIVLEPGLQVLG